MNREILLRARGFLGNILLDPPAPSLTPRQTEGPYRELAKSLADHGLLLRTTKTLVGHPVAEIHVNVQPIKTQPAFLLRMESGYVVPENDDRRLLHRYARVFAWERDLCLAEGFEQVPHPQDFPEVSKLLWPGFDERDRFSCLIGTNKSLRVAAEADLYQERQKIVRWFEERFPCQFDLYGRHWNLPMAKRGVSGGVLRALGKAGLRPKPLLTWRGQLPDKALALRRTKFSFALENVAGLDGYLSEKLFESLYEGCIPIYWGDPSVVQLLPDNIYVRYWDFHSLDELFDYLASYTRPAFEKTQRDIKTFLSSSEANELSSTTFAQTICRSIVDYLDGKE